MPSFSSMLRLSVVTLSISVAGAASAQCKDKENERPCRASEPHELWLGGRFDTLVESQGSGVRISTTRLSGSDNNDTVAGVALQVAGHSERYGVRRSFTMRNASFAFLGGGTQGFEGGVGGDVAWGARLPVSSSHGPLFRIGVRGYLFGNNALYGSLLEAPQLQLGYQYVARGKAIELSGRIGPVLVGRYNTGDDAYRKLGKLFELGGILGIHHGPVHVELEHTHVLSDGVEGDLDLLTGRTCGDAWFLQLCVDGRYGHGDAFVPTGAGSERIGPVESLYAGVTIGVIDRAFRHRDPQRHPSPAGPEPEKKVIAGE